MHFSTSVANLPNIGPITVKRLAKLNIKTVGNLIYHFPTKYLDRSEVKTVNQIKNPTIATLAVKLNRIANIYTRNHKVITKAQAIDKTGAIEIIWFNQPYLVNNLKEGVVVNLSGKIDFLKNHLAMISPDYEIITGQDNLHTARIVPIYPSTAGLTSKLLRSKIYHCLKSGLDFSEFIPVEVIKKNKLINLESGLKQIHFPDSFLNANIARKRFAFEEMFLFQLRAVFQKNQWLKNKRTAPFKISNEKLDKFIADLPFSLTNSQKKCLDEIIFDLKKLYPMNRLLQGEVGSGKTIVAGITAYLAHLNNLKTIIMAPTEILAQQHFQTLNAIFAKKGIRIGLFTKNVKTDEFDILVGTHALLNLKNLEDKKVGLIVIDEQHRFGVTQRGKLLNLIDEKQKTPHLLTMTATPIPRTVALTIYGDLDISIISELPEGRRKVLTYSVPDYKRQKAYDFIKKEVNKNNQVFIICPFIEKSETLASVKSAKIEFARLKKEIFPEYKLGLLHGSLKSTEKERVLTEFKSGQFDILVATPVVEVGIDIPKATVILIEAADRFGLAQLHQLRGRVGRGHEQSYCFLFTESASPKTHRRLKIMEKVHIGLELAQKDLEMRGSGEIFGFKQHGEIELKVGNFLDLELIKITRREAEAILRNDPDLKKYPDLLNKINSLSLGIEPN